MCEPVTIATGLAIASGASTFLQQSQATRAQASHQRLLHKENERLANANARRGFISLSQREVQEREKAAAAALKVSTDALKARGTARVTAAESGATGVSIDALLADFERQEVNFQTQNQRNLNAVSDQLALEAEGIRGQTQGRILSTLPQPVQQPSFIGAALRIGGDVIGIRTSFDQATTQAEEAV